MESLCCRAEINSTVNQLCMHVLSRFSHLRLFATLGTVACQAPLSIGLCRQEYWMGVDMPSSGDLPHPGIEPTYLMSPSLAGRFFTTSATWEACTSTVFQYF